ncbi:IS1380 family transposase, partial [Planctomycetota bacterium]
ILDMDSSESPTFGRQEGSAYNGHFGYTCYHPLFVLNQFDDVERVLLRNGNVHSADDWLSVLEPIVSRYRDFNIARFFRGDAAFANPNMYCYLEAEDYFYAIRLIGNPILENKIEHLMTRPVGHPPKQPIVLYESFQYRAASWNTARRVVAKIEWHVGELFPRVGFIVTNLRWKSSNVVKFYNKRGTAEQWIKEGKYALNWTRLSCHDFVDNQVRLQLFALAYNLGNFLRRLALPRKIKDWSLRTLQVKLIKIGAKVIRHSRYVIFQMAEVMVSKRLFQEILERIGHLKPVSIGFG